MYIFWSVAGIIRYLWEKFVSYQFFSCADVTLDAFRSVLAKKRAPVPACLEKKNIIEWCPSSVKKHGFGLALNVSIFLKPINPNRDLRPDDRFCNSLRCG